MGRIDLTILVVSYDTKGFLNNCLNSIYQYTSGIKFEVILVDNSSTDGSIEMIKEEFPQVKLIENRQNLGFARANNQAIKKSKGKYLLLFNPDTVFRANSPDKMIKFMDDHPEIGILGCKILNADGTIQPSNSSFPNLFTEFLRVFQLKRMIPSVKLRKKIGQKWGRLLGLTLREYFRVYWDSERTREVDWVTGACLLVRRKAIQDVGLLDENFFMYYEDADWCYRIRKRGWKVFYCPFFEVVHYVDRSEGRFSPRTFIERYKSTYHYFRKHKGKQAAFFLRLLIFGGLALRGAGLSVIYPFSGKRGAELRKKLYAYLKAIEAGGF